MTIEEFLKMNDIHTYRELERMKQKKKKEKVKLGDSPENLMKANAYKRQGRRIHQTRWE